MARQEQRKGHGSRDGPLVASVWQDPKESRIVELQPTASQVRVNMNSSRIVEEVSGIRHCTTFQEAKVAGAQSQWRCDSRCAVDVVHFAAPRQSMSWGDLTGEVLDPEEDQKARRLAIEYFLQMGKAPAVEARNGDHFSLRSHQAP